jgi:hypothetical protein
MAIVRQLSDVLGVTDVESKPPMPTQPQSCEGFLFEMVLDPRRAPLSQTKGQHRGAGPRRTDRTLSFTASLADHLEIGYPQVAVLLFACRLLHVAFFLLLCFFLGLGFTVSGTG